MRGVYKSGVYSPEDILNPRKSYDKRSRNETTVMKIKSNEIQI